MSGPIDHKCAYAEELEKVRRERDTYKKRYEDAFNFDRELELERQRLLRIVSNCRSLLTNALDPNVPMLVLDLNHPPFRPPDNKEREAVRQVMIAARAVVQKYPKFMVLAQALARLDEVTERFIKEARCDDDCPAPECVDTPGEEPCPPLRYFRGYQDVTDEAVVEDAKKEKP
jgi:hypothetical protein